MSGQQHRPEGPGSNLAWLFDLLDPFDVAWRKCVEGSGPRPTLREFLEQLTRRDASLRSEGFRWLLEIELEYRRRLGQEPQAEEYLKDYPEFSSAISEVFRQEESQAQEEVPWRLASGSRLGRYVIEHRLGAGGMGVVYKARDVELGRSVALKLLRADAPAEAEELARFRTEAEVLARLDHPGIVPLYEYGVHQRQPYLVLGYVRGPTLQQVIAQGPLAPGEAARLVQECARAIHYAHTRGVIHRDLKPSNVLLEWSGEADGETSKDLASGSADFDEKKDLDSVRVRITDFGLAKFLHRRGQTLTATDQVLGTPSYMAPEQARALQEQTGPATDVYALGAILYACLTGRPPFQAATALETLRQVEGQEPVLPRALNPQVPRDLETIALKCLQKSPQRRYASARELAEDLERFRRGEPILARPVGRLERSLRWCQRNPRLAVSVGLVVLLLLVLSTGGPWMAWRQSQLRRQAEQAALRERQAREQAQQATRAERVARRLAEKRQRHLQQSLDVLLGVFSDLDPQSRIFAQDRARRPESLSAQLAAGLLRAAEQLQQEALGDPVATARLRARLAATLLVLGYAQPARKLLEQSVEILEKHLGPHHEDTYTAQFYLAHAYYHTGPAQEAERIISKLYREQRRRWGPGHPRTLMAQILLAGFHLRQGQVAQARQELEEIRKHTQSHLDQKPGDGEFVAIDLQALHQLALTLIGTGELDEARRLLEGVLPWTQRVFGPLHPTTLSVINDLTNVYMHLGRYDRALPLAKRHYELVKQAYGQRHSLTLEAMATLGSLYRQSGRHDEAVALLKRLHEQNQAVYGSQSEMTLAAANNLAIAYIEASRFRQALELLQQILPVMQARLGREHRNTLTALNNLAVAYRELGQRRKALPVLEEVLKRRIEKLGQSHPRTIVTMVNLGQVYLDLGKFDKAFPLLEQSVLLATKRLGTRHPRTLLFLNKLAWGYMQAGRPEDAVEIYEKNLPRVLEVLGPQHPLALDYQANLADCYRKLKKHEKAIEILEKITRQSALALGESHIQTLQQKNNLALAYWDAGQLARAQELFEKIVAVVREKLGRRHPETLAVLTNLALLYQEQNRPEKAVPLWEEIFQALKESKGLEDTETLSAALHLARAYLQAGQQERAEGAYAHWVAGQRKQLKDTPHVLAIVLTDASRHLLQARRYSAAQRYAQECLQIAQEHKILPETLFQAMALLGQALAAQGKHAQAEKLLLENIQELQKRKGQLAPDTWRHGTELILRQLVALYQAWDKPEQARHWQTELDRLQRENSPNK